MKKRYKVLIIIGAVIAVLIIAGIIAFSSVEKSLEALKVTDIEDVSLSEVKDGVYIGSYSAFPVSAEVRVKVKGHAIEEIVLVKHTHGQGGAAETIPQRVVEAQSLSVDAVSGATYSSKVILLAIEDALGKGAALSNPLKALP